MIIDCISDLHGHYPRLEGGDLLIIAGDLAAGNEAFYYSEFDAWLHFQDYKKKIVIAGNHDNFLQNRRYDHYIFHDKEVSYLCDSGIEFEGFKIWGSPWTKTFENINPRCMAFTCEAESELAEKWKLIPNDIDILVTHGPPLFILDQVNNGKMESVGSSSLEKVVKRIQPKLHVFGHIHESYGQCAAHSTICVNASYVNEFYKPVNKPIRIVL